MASGDVSLLMGEALKEAYQGAAEGEVPVGAVVANPDGEIVARAHNQPIGMNDPTAHAEVLALRRAGAVCGNYRIAGSTLVVTVEPCLMCMGAALQARISRIVFGVLDPKAGAAGSLYDLAADPRLNHRIEIVSGIRARECQDVLQRFFRLRRGKGKPPGEVPKWS